MRWNAERYETWFDSPEGHVALNREALLLETMLKAWPRRGQRVLDIGCGTGIFLEKLWGMGFDVTGLDKSPSMLEGARKRLRGRATLHVGDGTHTPYDDNAFDYAVIWSVLEFCARPEALLEEATRVAEKGILIGFLNRFSLYYFLNVRRSTGTMSNASLLNPLQVSGMARRATQRAPSFSRSVLPGPLSTWKEGRFWGRINDRVYPSWVGAFSAMRIDFGKQKPLTPLLLWQSESKSLKEPRCETGAACRKQTGETLQIKIRKN